MTPFRVAFDLTQAKLGRIGPSLYIWRLHDALAPLLGARLVPIASRLARPLTGATRTVRERLATVARDLWWHQIGVTRTARRLNCQLLHLPGSVGPIIATDGIAAVVTIHDVMAIRFPEMFRPWYRHYARMVLPHLARRARGVITGSAAAKSEIVEWLRVPAERVHVIPYGVDEVFRPVAPDDPRASAVRRRYGLPSAFILAVGSIEPRKNLPRLLEAVHQLRAERGGVDIALVHAGPEGWQPETARRAVQRLGLSEVTRFLGYVPLEDLAILYSLARVFAYPSLWEGFGMPVLEAMACACPVVTSNVSSLPEVAGDAAVQVNPASTDDLARGIASVLDDEALRKRLVARGVERASRFTWARAARETIGVYEAALA